MHLLTNEDPEAVIPFVGVAIFSLLLLFSVSLTEASFKQVAQSFEPAKSMLAVPGQGMIAAWEGAEEAVYATAVYTGVIPTEESSYYAVALPFHTGAPRPQVASAVANAPEQTAVELPDPVDINRTPWGVLFRMFGGQQ